MISPFRFGDIFLLQRLGRQAAKLNTIQSLLQPQSSFWTSLTGVVPWQSAKAMTYVLRQPGHDLIGYGFLQAQKRPGVPEVDILCLAPGLDTPLGHPVIWEKLLSHYNAEATQQQIARIYVDVPDQPLPIATFSHVGFKVYARQTIWRLNPYGVEDFSGAGVIASSRGAPAMIRAQTKVDGWALQRLYYETVPRPVQIAEGMHAENGAKPPILEWRHAGTCSSFVLEEASEIKGAIQVVQGTRGFWLQLWADTLNPDTNAIHSLLRYGLTLIHRRGRHLPVYAGVCDYQGGVSSILYEYGFAPFTDRAKMVRHVVQWVREPAMAPVAAETVAGVVPTSFRLPLRPVGRRQRVLACAAQCKIGQHDRSGTISVVDPSLSQDQFWR